MTQKVKKDIAHSDVRRIIRGVAGKLPALFGLVLLIASLFAIWREVKTLSVHDVLVSLGQIPGFSLWQGAGATLIAYVILSFYDGLACRQVDAKISWMRSGFVAFCSYVLSHNLGCAAISGTAVRYRLYRSWGVSGTKIAGIVAFCSLTYLLGTMGLIGLVLLWQPQAVPLVSHLPLLIPRLIGGGCYAILLLYLVFSCYKREIIIGKWTLCLPDWRMGVLQIVISMADMSATALIAWCVLGPLPPGSTLNFGSFLAIYIASYTVGLMAGVPGGLGVFDGAMVLALAPWLPVPRIMGAILVFRLFYYIIPLIFAGLMFVSHELFLRGSLFLPRAVLRFFPKLVGNIVVRESEADFSVGVAAGVQVLLGVATIIYAMLLRLPFFHSRIDAWLVQGAVFLLLLCGVMLVGLAVGLSQRVTLAWRLSLLTHCFSFPLLYLCNSSWIAYFIAGSVMLMLLTFRACYYRQSHWRVAPLSPTILLPFSLLFVSFIGIYQVAHHRHLGDLWWSALIYDAHTGAGRWFLGGAIVCFVCALICAVRRTKITPQSWDEENKAQYNLFLSQSLSKKKSDIFPFERLSGHGIVPDNVLYDGRRRALAVFKRVKNFILVLGVPVGDRNSVYAVIWRLRDYAEQEDCYLAFLQERDDLANIYSDVGLNQFQLEQIQRGEKNEWFLFCPIEEYSRLYEELIILEILEKTFRPLVPLSLSGYSLS